MTINKSRLSSIPQPTNWLQGITPRTCSPSPGMGQSYICLSVMIKDVTEARNGQPDEEVHGECGGGNELRSSMSSASQKLIKSCWSFVFTHASSSCPLLPSRVGGWGWTLQPQSFKITQSLQILYLGPRYTTHLFLGFWGKYLNYSSNTSKNHYGLI